MIDKTSFQVQGDNLLQAWNALQEADEQDEDGDSPEVDAVFGKFSEMVNSMMDKGVLGDVIEHLGERMQSGEIEMESDMMMDIIDSLSVCVSDENNVSQLIAVPLEGEASRVFKMARSTNWNKAIENFGIVQGQCELVGVARDTEMSLLMLDVVAVGALTRGLITEGVHQAFLDEGSSGQFNGVALLRFKSDAVGSELLGDVLVADKQEGVERWAQGLSDNGKILAQGPRLTREGVAAAATQRVLSTLEKLRATEADQGQPGIAVVMFGFESERDLSPDEMFWMGALYRDGTAASIQAVPAALVPMITVMCGLIEDRHGIEARTMELSDMLASVWSAEKQLGSATGGAGKRLH